MGRFENVGLCCGGFPSHDIGEKIFGGENTIQTQMTVEAALSRVQASLGIIPAEAAEEITKKCDQALISEEKYFEQINICGGHILVALVRLYGDICDNGYGQFVHYGTTTQDILDTATMVQLKQAWEVIEQKTEKLVALLKEKAMLYRSLVVMGRTNDQQAIPLTLGFRIASWADEMQRSLQRLREDKDRVFVGQFGGAVGTLATLKENGMAILNGLMNELGLGTPTIAWYAARDRLAEICADLCILCGSMGRIGNEIYNASRTEVNEYAEGFRAGKVGSSTMPHKRNPFQSSHIVAYSRLSRSVMIDALSAMESTSERDTRSLFTENEFLAKAFLLADCCLDETLDLVEKMEVHQREIDRNLNLLGGLVFAESIMMALAKTCGRLKAHEIVYESAQEAISTGKSFRDLLLADERVSAVLTADQLDELMVPENYIGLSETFVDLVCQK